MNKTHRIIVRLLLVVGLIGLVYYAKQSGWANWLSLETLKEQKNQFEQIRLENPVGFIFVYFIVYVLCAALSIPGATVLTLAGGAFFGVIAGTIIVSFASTVGATLAFLVSRFLLRDWVQQKFGSKLKTINDGVRSEGAHYLFALRLIPLFPFFVVNLLMGLTPLRLGVYYVISQIGMFPATLAYVYAGSELGKVTSLTGLLSPRLILAFCVLGTLPFFLKRILFHLKKPKGALAKTKAPKKYDYNLLVIGGGSAGLVSAYIGAAVKAKTALIEANKMGGDCLNTGCVPSKAILRSAKIASYIKRAQEFGLKTSELKVDFKGTMKVVHKVIESIEPHDSVERYTELGVECIKGKAEIIDPYTVSVDGRKKITAKNIIIATGAKPRVPDIKGINDIPFVTSDTLWEIEKQPEKLLVLGGGPIGLELAQAFLRLGSKVCLVEATSRLLAKEDHDVSLYMLKKLQAEGMEIRLNTSIEEFKKESGKNTAKLAKNGGSVDFDPALFAVGRTPNVSNLGLEKLGIEKTVSGHLKVDSRMRVGYPNIFACGDVVGPYAFTHVSSHQAWYASVNALFRPFWGFDVDYRVIPWATFTDPEVAKVGLNEAEAKEQGIEYDSVCYDLSDLDRAIADHEAHGWIKVLTQKESDKILGATIVGHRASDLISEFVLAMKHGIGMNKILGTIHIYPTFSEGNKYAAGLWKKKSVSQATLKYLEKFHQWRR